MTSVRDLIAHLERHCSPDDIVAAATRQVADIAARAEARGIAFDDTAAAAIIERMDRQQEVTAHCS